MTTEKTPELMVVVIRTDRQQWFVAGVDLQGDATPLVRSEPDNLDQYIGEPYDEQVSFLRHRLSGAMQRGCDRLWARNAKAMRIVLIADDHLADAEPRLLSDLADHLHTWMTRPPVSVYRAKDSSSVDELSSMHCLVGEPESGQKEALMKGLPQLSTMLDAPDRWEVIQKPKA